MYISQCSPVTVSKVTLISHFFNSCKKKTLFHIMATQYATADLEAPSSIPNTQGYSTTTSTPAYTIPSNQGPQPTTIVFVTDTAQPLDYTTLDNIRDPHAECLPCAIVGFIFAWIPIVGIATWICNMDAPRNTMRSIFSQSACCIATFVIIFNIIFWSAYRL